MTTPLHGWPTPADTDRVMDGALAIRDLADAIDHRMPAGLLGYAEDGTNRALTSTGTDLTVAEVTVDIPSGGRLVLVSGYAQVQAFGGTAQAQGELQQDGAPVGRWFRADLAASAQLVGYAAVRAIAAAGSRTYRMRLEFVSGTASELRARGDVVTSQLMVTDLGPA